MGNWNNITNRECQTLVSSQWYWIAFNIFGFAFYYTVSSLSLFCNVIKANIVTGSALQCTAHHTQPNSGTQHTLRPCNRLCLQSITTSAITIFPLFRLLIIIAINAFVAFVAHNYNRLRPLSDRDAHIGDSRWPDIICITETQYSE